MLIFLKGKIINWGNVSSVECNSHDNSYNAIFKMNNNDIHIIKTFDSISDCESFILNNLQTKILNSYKENVKENILDLRNI